MIRILSSGIVNGARCFIEDFEFLTTKTNTLRLKRVWVIFPDAATGSLLREDSKRKGITNNNPLAVPISEIKASFYIPRIKQKVTRTQFPIVLCFCMTSYKSQGQTLDAVIVDFQDAIAKHGHFYVGITRVRNSDGLFVRNFKPSQVLCRDDVKTQMKLLRRNKNYNFSKTYLDTKIWNSSSELKVGYININGLLHNINNLDKDYNSRNLDFLCIAETKLDISVPNDQINENLNECQYEILYRQDVKTTKDNPHMGMIILKNKNRTNLADKVEGDIIEYSSKKMQIIRLSVYGNISILFVYINKTPGIAETHDIGKVLAEKNVSVVLGDFNIDYHKEDGRKKIAVLEKRLGMTQINRMSTRYKATLDLLFRKEMKETDFMPYAFENLFSDHSSIGFRYCENGQISDDFKKQKIFLQDKEFLRKVTIESEKEIKQEPIIINQESENDNVIFECPVDIVRISNLRKLATGEWVDSNVINCYMFLIGREYPGVLIFDTQFNERLKTRPFHLINRGFRNSRIFEQTLWLAPINCNNLHWFLLAIHTHELIAKKIKIDIYDSSPDFVDWKDIIDEILWKSFFNWKHHEDFKDNEIQLEITFDNSISDVPRQTNGVDCGVFSLMYARCLAAGLEFDFQQEDMRRFRQQIFSELSAGKLNTNLHHNEYDGGNFDLPKTKKKDGRTISDNSPRRKFPEKDNKSNNRKDDNSTKKKNKEDVIDLTEEATFSPEREALRNVKQPVISRNMKIFRFVNRNNRNLCFSNAVTSILLNNSGITDIIVGDTPLRFENAIFKELKQLYERENLEYSSTRRLRQIVDSECLMNMEQKNFDDNNQHDAAEFLLSLLQHLLENDNALINHLFGRTTTAIFCCNENCNSVVHQSQVEVKIIMLPLVEYTLESNLQRFLDEEVIERTCSKCNHKQGTQVTSFTEDPEILVFQLKRFKAEENRISKIDSEIFVPSRINLQSGSLYQIIGTVNHMGNSPASGHYTSTVYNETKKNFYLINDEEIQEIESLNDTVYGQLISKTIYLIFYRHI